MGCSFVRDVVLRARRSSRDRRGHSIPDSYGVAGQVVQRCSCHAGQLTAMLLEELSHLAAVMSATHSLMCGMSDPSEEANVTRGRQLVIGRQPDGYRIELD
jgi:hypothetical protein